MCDETLALKERPVVAVAGPVAAFDAPQAGLTEAMVDVPTQDGTCEAFFVHPAEGRHPGVILWPDAFGLRPVNMAMARRLAAEGYAVLAVNAFYRTHSLPIELTFADLANEAGLKQIYALVGSVTAETVAVDAPAFVAFLDDQASVDSGRGIGTQGYCMGGALAFYTAANVPNRVTAVASFHGGRLATDAPTSPHKTFGASQATYLILPGRDDNVNEPHAVEALRAAADAAGRNAEIEVFAADHGWCVPDNPTYDEGEAERAWVKLLALYEAL